MLNIETAVLECTDGIEGGIDDPRPLYMIAPGRGGRELSAASPFSQSGSKGRKQPFSLIPISSFMRRVQGWVHSRLLFPPPLAPRRTKRMLRRTDATRNGKTCGGELRVYGQPAENFPDPVSFPFFFFPRHPFSCVHLLFAPLAVAQVAIAWDGQARLLSRPWRAKKKKRRT